MQLELHTLYAQLKIISFTFILVIMSSITAILTIIILITMLKKAKLVVRAKRVTNVCRQENLLLHKNLARNYRIIEVLISGS